MVEIVVLVLAVVGFVLFHENRSRLKKAESELLSLRQRVEVLENAPARVVTQADAVAATDGVDASAPAQADEPASELQTTEPALAAEAPAELISEPVSETPIAAAVSEPQPAKPARSLESRLGAQWTVWIGGLALAVGGLFAVKYSIDQGLLSPEVRVSLAGLFGLVLWAAGEFVRRRTPADQLNAFQSALIPGMLTAAGTLTLFGALYVAHGVFEFIGPATAFVLMALVAFVTLGLSLLHGQALAGLGLLAAFVTPLLITSGDPRPWSLFGFLTLIWVATSAASRLRNWQVVPSLANVGLGGWALLYISDVEAYDFLPPGLAILVMLAGVALFWPGSADAEIKPVIDKDGTMQPPDRALQLIAPPYVAIVATAAAGALMTAIGTVAPDLLPQYASPYGFLVIVLAMLALAALRLNGLSALGLGVLAVFGGLTSMVNMSLLGNISDPADTGIVLALDPAIVIRVGLLLAAGFLVAGGFAIRRFVGSHADYATAWAGVLAVVPVLCLTITFINLGNYSLDWTHGLSAIVIAFALAGLAEWLGRSQADARNPALNLLVGGSWLALVAAIVMLTNNLASIILVAALGFAYLMASRIRTWWALPWAMVASGIAAAGMIALDPTIVGVAHLSNTPVFNQLLTGYGIPALLLVIAAWLLRDHPEDRLVNTLQALASLFVLMTFAIEVRHLMQGGVLDNAEITLAEQSVYTLLAIGASATMMALGLKRPTIVFKWGSMLIGAISMLMVLGAHLFGLNPYFSGESTGTIPVFNLLLIGYLVPGLAYAALAAFARDRRPRPYVVALALTGSILIFFYVSLSVRRFWHGPQIEDWKGFLQSEMYTYSVVWLILGVVLLVAGYRFRAQSVRIASAVLVFITVFKVFLFDMSNLEGFLRPLSFIGLGAVLIGIGRFYQHILMGPKKVAAEPVAEPDATPQA